MLLKNNFIKFRQNSFNHFKLHLIGFVKIDLSTPVKYIAAVKRV